MIGILGAMSVETEKIRQLMQVQKTEKKGGLECCVGTWLGRDIVVATCGIGKVSAAMGAMAMILSYAPDLIINTGVAGGIAPGISLLDTVVAEAVVQHDVDTSALGDPKGMISGIELVQIPCVYSTIVEAVRRQVDARADVVYGIIASGDQFVADTVRAAQIREDFEAAAVDMESGSIGQVCYMSGVQCLILRTISDSGDDVEYQEFAGKAAEKSVALLAEILGT